MEDNTYMANTGFLPGVYEHIIFSLLRQTVAERQGKTVSYETNCFQLQWAYLNIASQGYRSSDLYLQAVMPSAEWSRILNFENYSRGLLLGQILAMGYARCYQDPIEGARLLSIAYLLAVGSDTSPNSLSGLPQFPFSLPEKPATDIYLDRSYLQTLRLCGELLAGTPACHLRQQLLDEYQDKFGRLELVNTAQDDLEGQIYLLSLGTDNLAQQLLLLFTHALAAEQDIQEHNDWSDIWVRAYNLVLRRLLESSGGFELARASGGEVRHDSLV